MSQRGSHWMVGQQSFLDLQAKSYRVAPEPAISDAFLDARIKEVTVWKTFIPLYYQAITRTPRSRLRRIPRFYDPLIDVSNDRLNITMRATDNRQYWNIEWYENMFTDANFDKGHCFVDFNINFIEQIRRMKSNDIGYLLVDETGLEYASNVDTSFLPNEDRGSLIKLLKQVQSEFDLEPDEEKTFLTADAYDHKRIEGFTGIPLFDLRLPAGQTKFVVNRRTRRRERSALSEWGEAYNPFYIFRTSKAALNSSKMRPYFGATSKVSYWEDSCEYLIETPLQNAKKEEVGRLRLFTTGRDLDSPTLDEPTV